MIPPYFTWTPLALVLAAITGTALVLYGRRGDPDRPRKPSRCKCGNCRTESPLAPWERRVWAVITPGPGRLSRIRHGLGRAEYAERVRFGMPMNHPDWITGCLREEFEELLAELDAELEDM